MPRCRRTSILYMPAWFLEWFMELNVSKCKFMVISKKRTRYGSPVQLCIDGVSLERVNEFKYLGVWLTDTLGWSVHVNKTVRRASKQVSMIYRTFYQYANQLTLLKLYLAHVWPLLEYASQLLDRHQKVLIDSLERVQKFGLRMSCKQWRSDYESLLAWADLPSLKARRAIAKLCYLNKMLRGVMHSSIPLPKPRIMDARLRSFQDSMLLQPFARTNNYKLFFFILTQLHYGIIYLPGWVTVLMYRHLRIICVSFSANVFLCFHPSLYHLLFFVCFFSYVGAVLELAFICYCQPRAVFC